MNGSPPFKSTKHIKSGERVKASEKKHRIGLFPRLVQKISYPSEALSSAAAVSTGDPEDYGPGEETSPVRLLSTPVVAQASDVTDRDEMVRRRRQRRIRKLEHQDELQKQKSKLLTTPGERIFPLPSKVRPISLFIRMGSLPSEQEPVPLEYYGASDEGEEDKSLPLTLSAAAATTVTPHPAALQTRQLFHLGEGFATASPRQAKAIHGRPRTMPVILPFHSTALPKRPFSIQIPPMTSISSALKKDADDVDGRKRPRSLRFLDPGDQKLYAAISHEVFLAQLRHRAEERTLRRSLGDVSIADSDDDILGVTERKVNYLDSTETTARTAASSTDDSGGDTLGSAPRPPQEKTHLLSLDRLCTSSAPPTLTDSMMDTEGSNPQDWALSEAIGDNDVLQRAPPPRFIGNFSRTQSMPIFPKESFSLESSDTSGCEADAEERHRSIITERRGSVAGR